MAMATVHVHYWEPFILLVCDDLHVLFFLPMKTNLNCRTVLKLNEAIYQDKYF